MTFSPHTPCILHIRLLIFPAGINAQGMEKLDLSVVNLQSHLNHLLGDGLSCSSKLGEGYIFPFSSWMVPYLIFVLLGVLLLQIKISTFF